MTSIIGGFRPAVKGAWGQQADPVRSHVRLMNALSGALSKCSCELGVISLAPGTRVAPSAHFGSEILSPSPVPKPGHLHSYFLPSLQCHSLSYDWLPSPSCSCPDIKKQNHLLVQHHLLSLFLQTVGSSSHPSLRAP